MPDSLPALYEARRPLLEHVAHSLELEVKDCLARCDSIDRVRFHVASASAFSAKAQRLSKSNTKAEPLVEIEDQIAGHIDIGSLAALSEAEAVLRATFSVLEVISDEAATPDTMPRRRMLCLIPPQAKPPAWDARHDLPRTFTLELSVATRDDSLPSATPDDVTTVKYPMWPSPASEAAAPQATVARSSQSGDMEWDVFISHAYEDKDDVARPLANKLIQHGLKVWFDEYTLTLGDSLRRSIDKGLARSRFGLVILSPHFFEKEWTQKELDGLVAREDGSEKRILPVWHNVARNEVVAFSPPLADKLGVSTSKGLDHVVEQILRVFDKQAARSTSTLPGGGANSPLPAGNTPSQPGGGGGPTLSAGTGSVSLPGGTGNPTRPAGSGNAAAERPVEHVVLLVHGIRTEADWQEMVAEQIEYPGIRVFPIRYGYFDAFQFLLPGPTRRWPVQRVLKEIRIAKDRYPTAQLSIIAHSFGTYVVSQIVREHFDIRFHRVLFCGAVVPSDFPWERVLRQITEDQVVNECGKSDVWPVMAKSVTWGYGASGTHGFGSVAVKDRFHAGGHSQYFSKQFVEQFWVPFIRHGEVRRSKWETARPSTPLWLSLVGWFPLKYVFLVIAVILLLPLAQKVAPFAFGRLVEAITGVNEAKPVELVDATFQDIENDKYESDSRAPRLDLKLSNPNDHSAFVKRVDIHVNKIWNLRSIPAIPEKFVEPSHTYVERLKSSGAPYDRSLVVSQEIEAGKVDRFVVQFQAEPKDEDNRAIYYATVSVTADASGTTSEKKEVVFLVGSGPIVPTTEEIQEILDFEHSVGNDGVKRETLEESAATNRGIVEEVAKIKATRNSALQNLIDRLHEQAEEPGAAAGSASKTPGLVFVQQREEEKKTFITIQNSSSAVPVIITGLAFDITHPVVLAEIERVQAPQIARRERLPDGTLTAQHIDVDYVVFKHGHWVADIVEELGRLYRFETRVGLKIGANDVGDISPEIVGREWAGTTFIGTLTIEFKGGTLTVPDVTIVGRKEDSK